MDRNSEFAHTFGNLAGIIKFSIAAQGIGGLFLIWFFILPNIGESFSDDLGKFLYFFLFVIAVIGAVGAFLVLLFIFCVRLGRLKRFRSSFGMLSVFGCIACLLPVPMVFYLVNTNNSYILYIVPVCVGMAILSIKPVYYELMREEVREIVSSKASSKWRFLLIIHIVFVLLCATSYAFFVMWDPALFGNSMEKFHQQSAEWSTLTIAAVIAAAAMYYVRLVVEYIVTADTADIL